MVVSMLISALVTLALGTGSQADHSSASDRNHEQALGVAEMGLNQVVARIASAANGVVGSGPNFWTLARGTTSPAGCHQGGQCAIAAATNGYNGTGPQGKYWYWVTRTSSGYVIDAESVSGGTQLGRKRHVQITLEPPPHFPGDAKYALFSYTNIVVGANDQILGGDLFANDSIDLENSNNRSMTNPTVQGSLTSARSWIRLQNNDFVTGNVWSGGYNADPTANWALDLEPGADIGGWVKASNTQPSDNCSDSHYSIAMANGASIVGSVTTLAPSLPAGTTGTPKTCTAAAPAQTMPAFVFNANDYDPATYHPELDSVAKFQAWLSNNLDNFQGTFFVNDPAPSQTNRIDLTGAHLTGPATIVTNAPVFTSNLDDSQIVSPPGATFDVVSHYVAPVGTSCTLDARSDSSECAIHVKNTFTPDASGTCKTASLLYADLAPVAIKNSSKICGSVMADGLLVQNGQTVNYDDRITRTVGFGSETYVVDRWEELPI